MLFSCRSDIKKGDSIKSNDTKIITGETMGTTYRIAYNSRYYKNITREVDSLLIGINQSLSTYIPTSFISCINTDSLWKTDLLSLDKSMGEYITYHCPLDSHFLTNYDQSIKVYENTEGYYDPTVMPLVNYWGFGYTAKDPVTIIDSNKIKSIMTTVGFNKWEERVANDSMLIIKPRNSKIDFSAIAKGYAVDKVGELLDTKGIENYLVEIGGEVYCKGTKSDKSPWTIALSKPLRNANINEVELSVHLNNLGLASSGNYRNFHIVDDVVYGHEINPHIGFPESNDLLGVSVIAPKCMIADAYATAFMVMGKNKSIQLVEKLDNIEAVFFHLSGSGDIIYTESTGFKDYVKP